MPEFLFAGERYQSPVELALEVIGGKWKMPILWRLHQRSWRYGELQRDLPRVTHKMLSQQLRELEEAGLITRTVQAVVPPRVDYAITTLGQSALPAIDALRSWGAAYRTARDPGWQPTLDGPRLRVRPLAASDFEPLYSVANDPDLWAQHPEPTRWQRPVFETFFASALACGSAVVAEERATGKIVACSRYYDIDPAVRRVAIGYTFVARSHWGGATNGELKALMLAYAFTQVDVVWFHIGRDNHRSRKAAEKIGAVLDHEGLRDQQPYCWYRIGRPPA